MNKEFVPYEVANELKQLGFDYQCIHHYKKNMEGRHSTIPTFEMNTPFGKNHNSFTSRVSAPTYSQAFRFFRDKYDLYADIYRIGKKFNAGIEDMNIGSSKETVVEGVDYEEAELECLRKLIELVKNK
jgi:hypothetical protein